MKLLFALAVISAILTLAILITGVVGMARGGDFNRKYGNKLMQARVGAQFATLFFLALLAVVAAN